MYGLREGIMVGTILSDELINSTELRNNQKEWLDRAYISPVSIKSGRKRLVLLNRDEARDMYTLNHYAETIIQFCQEQFSGLGKSAIFPWVEYLTQEEIEEFKTELITTFVKAIRGRKWHTIEDIIRDWAATAEAKTNPEIMELLSTDVDKEEYTRVE